MAQIEAKKYESTISRRERNLDHWDVPTAAAYLGLHPETLKPLPQYASVGLPSSSSDGSSGSAAHELLDEYVGHDAAVLFYAQWCNNCHAVAPSWDAIATHVSAGSRSSKLIMALFDCEKDTRHMELCVAAGVKAYPTMMFIGSGEFHDTDFVTRSVLGKDKSAGPFGATTLPRTVKFQGNWQYGDQLLDWVNIMRGLSSWHTMSESGPLRGLRNGIFGFLTGGKGKRASSAAKLGKEGIPVIYWMGCYSQTKKILQRRVETSFQPSQVPTVGSTMRRQSHLVHPTTNTLPSFVRVQWNFLLTIATVSRHEKQMHTWNF